MSNIEQTLPETALHYNVIVKLLTEHGEERSFRSRESEIEALVRFAWHERVVITVITDAHGSRVPVSIILRRAPPQPRTGW